MKRFFTRHMSLRRRHGRYTLLSCSDTQLHCDRTLVPQNTAREDAQEDLKPSQSNISQRDSARRRRWYNISRRKKRRDSETTLVREREDPSHEDFEVAVEASPSHDFDTGHATLTRSVSASMLDVRNAAVDVEHFGAQVHHEICTSAMIPVPHIKGRTHRRFAICEELEREIIMDNGVNLRKSRKNLVIRQVLHDLLLL